MNPEMERKYQRLRSFFFGLCVLASGLFLLITGNNILKSTAAKNWAVYSGELEGSGITKHKGLYRSSWISYTYIINNKQYTGTRIGYGVSRADEFQVADKSIKVYVNPDDYTDAVLVAGVKKSHYIGLLFSAGFMWLGFYLWKRTR
jgi:hypothetical protein